MKGKQTPDREKPTVVGLARSGSIIVHGFRGVEVCSVCMCRR